MSFQGDPNSGRMFAMSEYERGKVKGWLVWVLWLFLGWVGAHRFYLRDPLKGVAFILVSIFLPFIGFMLLMVIGMSDMSSSEQSQECLNQYLNSSSGDLPAGCESDSSSGGDAIFGFLAFVFIFLAPLYWLFDAIFIMRDTRTRNFLVWKNAAAAYNVSLRPIPSDASAPVNTNRSTRKRTQT